MMDLEDGTRTKTYKNNKKHKRDSNKLSQIPAMNPLEENCCRSLYVLHVADFESSLPFFFLLAIILFYPSAQETNGLSRGNHAHSDSTLHSEGFFDPVVDALRLNIFA